MRRNKIRQILQEQQTVLNGWLHIPSSWSAELMSHAGWDSLTIDLQHGMHDVVTAVQMLQAISTTETVPMVRVNWHDPGIMMRLLDAGAYGIICPMVNTRAECEAFVGACLYPPRGYRSLGPTRAVLYAGDDYAAHANDEIMTLAMIETVEALDNLDDIASVPGLSGLFVGAGDLRLSMLGSTGFDTQDERFNAALRRIVEACERHSIVPGIFTASPEYARQMQAMGYRFITVKTDSQMLLEYARSIVRQSRSDQAAG